MTSGQTRFCRYRALTTSPARSTSAIRISRERLPTATGSLFFTSNLAAAVKRNGPKDAVSDAPEAPLTSIPASVVLKLSGRDLAGAMDSLVKVCPEFGHWPQSRPPLGVGATGSDRNDIYF